MISIETKACFNHKSYVLSKGALSVGILPSLGGRIHSISYKGEELLSRNTEVLANENSVIDLVHADELEALRNSWKLPAIGGAQLKLLFLSKEESGKEELLPSLLNLDFVPYKVNVTGRKIFLRSLLDLSNNTFLFREIEFGKNGDLQIISGVYNQGETSLKCSFNLHYDFFVDAFLSLPLAKYAFKGEHDMLSMNSKNKFIKNYPFKDGVFYSAEDKNLSVLYASSLSSFDYSIKLLPKVYKEGFSIWKPFTNKKSFVKLNYHIDASLFKQDTSFLMLRAQRSVHRTPFEMSIYTPTLFVGPKKSIAFREVLDLTEFTTKQFRLLFKK